MRYGEIWNAPSVKSSCETTRTNRWHDVAKRCRLVPHLFAFALLDCLEKKGPIGEIGPAAKVLVLLSSDEMQLGTMLFPHLLNRKSFVTELRELDKFFPHLLQSFLPVAVSCISLLASKPVLFIQLLNVSNFRPKTRNLFQKNFKMIHSGLDNASVGWDRWRAMWGRVPLPSPPDHSATFHLLLGPTIRLWDTTKPSGSMAVRNSPASAARTASVRLTSTPRTATSAPRPPTPLISMPPKFTTSP